ncbi:hypothetical protein INT44_000605 [Umbelopsis vinacea]|uniref:RRM domain-containing protein n=1 Tax=Umbelopsis vinacea TaxID=44442 RepID=A0A8H7Q974_9FUNG|nr:hypothetical protein INT44_000605 [Umbelopsis vinacea]
MDEYDELYGVGGGGNDNAYENQDIYADDQDSGQSYDPEKAGMYSNQANKAEDQSQPGDQQQPRKDSNSNYDQQKYYGGSENRSDSPQQQGYDRAPAQGQAIQSYTSQEESETHPSVASAANQDEGKMFVGGLNWETTDERLRDYFSKYGEVIDCVVMRDATTGKSRGFAFLTFADSHVVDEVASRSHQLDGKNIDPKRAIPRDEQDKTEKIFVGGIHQEVDEEEFREYFNRFGKVIDVTLMTDRATGRPRGFGFVTFESSQGVENALNMPGLAMRGKPVEVKRAMPKHRQQQSSHGGDSHGVAVNPYFNMYGKQGGGGGGGGGSRYAGAASGMAQGGGQGGRGGWYGGAGGGGGANMYGNYYGGAGAAGGGGYQNYQMMAAAAAAYYNRYMGYYANQQQQQQDYGGQGYQDDGYSEGNDGKGGDGGDDYPADDQDRGNDGGDQYGGGHHDRYGDSGRGGGSNYSRDPRRDPRSSSASYSSGSERNSRGNNGGGGGGGAVYASQSNRNQHNYRPY